MDAAVVVILAVHVAVVTIHKKVSAIVIVEVAVIAVFALVVAEV